MTAKPGVDPSQPAESHSIKRKVGLFVTCLVDLHRPNVGFAAIRLLEQAGCEVIVPASQTCCGQPAYNSGDDKSAMAIARQCIAAFEGVDYIVAPSGSCAGMIREHYPDLLADDPLWAQRAIAVAKRCHELLSFLVDICGFDGIDAEFDHAVTYHDSCSGLRELGIRKQPRQLLSTVGKLQLHEMEDTDVCCGFGGTFCVKFPEISERMVSDKVALVCQSGADTVLGGDLGCLLNIRGRLSRLGLPIQIYHAAEVLANMTDLPGIGQSADNSAEQSTNKNANKNAD